MKKTIVILLIFFVSRAASGQVYIGLSIGGNLCTIRQSLENEDIVSGDRDLKNTLGLGFGIPLQLGISDRLSLVSGFNHLQKGSAIDYEIPEFENEIVRYNGNTRYNYLEVPVQIRYYFVNRNLKVHGSLGLSFGYMLNAVARYDVTIINTIDNSETVHEQNDKLFSNEIKDSGINRFDISLAFGAGIEYDLWIGRIFLQSNYLLGLSNMMKDNNLGVGYITQYNRGFYTSVGYLFSLGK
jgi:hypothetical protein